MNEDACANVNAFLQVYWAFYLTLEHDFVRTERYVTVDQDNFNTYSVEYNRILQSTCSEVNVVAKKLCELLGNSNVEKMDNFRDVITQHCGMLYDETVEIGNVLKVQPWKEWGIEKRCNPIWWRLYNKVKHCRAELCENEDFFGKNRPFYKAATQENVLLALSGLYVLEFYTMLFLCYEVVGKTSEDGNTFYDKMLPLFSSQLFKLKAWQTCHCYFVANYINGAEVCRLMDERKISMPKGSL